MYFLLSRQLSFIYLLFYYIEDLERSKKLALKFLVSLHFDVFAIQLDFFA